MLFWITFCTCCLGTATAQCSDPCPNPGCGMLPEYNESIAGTHHDECEECNATKNVLECACCVNTYCKKGCHDWVLGKAADGTIFPVCAECLQELEEQREAFGNVTTLPDAEYDCPEHDCMANCDQSLRMKKKRKAGSTTRGYKGRTFKSLPALKKCEMKNCKLGCSKITTEARQAARDEFTKLRNAKKKGAKHEALMHVRSKTLRIESTRSDVGDKKDPNMRCKHCKLLPVGVPCLKIL